jgi:hypothetical protein
MLLLCSPSFKEKYSSLSIASIVTKDATSATRSAFPAKWKDDLSYGPSA